MSGRTYIGSRSNIAGGGVVRVNDQPLPLCLNLFNHSPAGFNWGYGGSGPAQLALAILMDFFSHEYTNGELARTNAVRYHQRFKEDIIAKIEGNHWSLNSSMIEAWFCGLAKEHCDEQPCHIPPPCGSASE